MIPIVSTSPMPTTGLPGAGLPTDVLSGAAFLAALAMPLTYGAAAVPEQDVPVVKDATSEAAPTPEVLVIQAPDAPLLQPTVPQSAFLPTGLRKGQGDTVAGVETAVLPVHEAVVPGAFLATVAVAPSETLAVQVEGAAAAPLWPTAVPVSDGPARSIVAALPGQALPVPEKQVPVPTVGAVIDEQVKDTGGGVPLDPRQGEPVLRKTTEGQPIPLAHRQDAKPLPSLPFSISDRMSLPMPTVPGQAETRVVKPAPADVTGQVGLSDKLQQSATASVPAPNLAAADDLRPPIVQVMISGGHAQQPLAPTRVDIPQLGSPKGLTMPSDGMPAPNMQADALPVLPVPAVPAQAPFVQQEIIPPKALSAVQTTLTPPPDPSIKLAADTTASTLQPPTPAAPPLPLPRHHQSVAERGFATRVAQHNVTSALSFEAALSPALTEVAQDQTLPPGVSAQTAGNTEASFKERPVVDVIALPTFLPEMTRQTVTAISKPFDTTPFLPPVPVQNLPAAIAEIARSGRAEAVSIRLDPVELGAVQVTMLGAEKDLTVVVVVERPESLDLLRRHADQFLADLRQSGFAGASLSFTLSDQRSGQNPVPQPPSPQVMMESDQPHAVLQTSPQSTARPTGLDMRL